jgi:hypothetical protein
MFRLSIAGILWLIVLAALNFAVLRYFEYFVQEGGEPIVPLLGLMPLFDAFLISFYAAVTKQYRFGLVRRAGRGGFAKSLAVTTGVLLALCMFLCFATPRGIVNLLEASFDFPNWPGNFGQHVTEGPLLGATLGVLMSGPLLVIATVFSLVTCRYRLVITRLSLDAPAVDDRPEEVTQATVRP